MRTATVGIFLTCLVVYHLNGRPQPEADCVAAPYTAWSLVRHGSLDLHWYPGLRAQVGVHIRALPDGTWVSIRSPGAALAAVPFVAPVALFREHPLGVNGMFHLGKLTAAASVAAAAALFYLLCRRLAPGAAWPATVLFALGTCLWSVASQALWMHGPATFGLCLALYLLIPGRDRGIYSLLAGAALGLAVLSRPTTALFALATLGALLAQRRWRATLWLTLGGAVPAAFLILLNWTTFGSPLLGGYAREYLTTESPPLWLGLSGLLIAPSRGLLVYTPALLLVLPGVFVLLRRTAGPVVEARGLLTAWLIASGLTLAFYARWHDWRGGWCYGPRFLIETMPTLCLLFGLGFEALRSQWHRRGALGLVVLSVAIQFLGVFGHGGYVAWQERHDLADGGRCLFALEDTQIEAHARAFLAKVTGQR